MRKRSLLLITVIFSSMIICTGCWNYREIDKLSIVAGVAIDKAEQGGYKITTEIVDLHEGGMDPKIKSQKLVSYGETLFDAVRNTIKITSAKLYWGHVEISIISQEVAKEGIVDILDFLNRDAEPRLSMDLLISREKTAAEILDLQSSTTEIRSYEINTMLDAQRSLSKTSKTQVYEFVNALSAEGISAVMPTIGAADNNGKEILDLSGTAMFKKDKLIDMIDGDETKAMLFVTDHIKGGLLIIKDNSESDNSGITLEIMKSKTKMKPQYSGGKLTINIEVTTKVALGEENKNAKKYDESINLSLRKIAEKMLKNDMEDIITKVQQDIGADIFGFGKLVSEDMPDLWKKIGPDWEQVFKKLDVRVNTKIELKDSGLLSKPIKVGD